MHITGFPRSGSSLLLLLCAGSVTNKAVYAVRESPSFRTCPHVISKDPFTYLRYSDIREPLYLVRDPRAVLTSKHGNGTKFYWDDRPKLNRAPHSLKEHFENLGTPRLKYEDLCQDPDGVQQWIRKQFGLKFDRKWSEWPFDGFSYPEYWDRSLGSLGPIRPARKPMGEFSEEIEAAARSLGY